MARMAVDDGITHTICTPHIYPGMYENNADIISKSCADFQKLLDEADIDLKISYGADIQQVPEIPDGLADGWMPTLNHSKYFLFEPPHHIAPPYFISAVQMVIDDGYIPLITHPERLTWVVDHYDDFVQVAANGAWIQITSGAITGRFGKNAQQWAERFIKDGLVHIIATDAHSIKRRPPYLAEGAEAAAKWLGDEEAKRTVYDRPKAVWDDADPESIITPPAYNETGHLIHRPQEQKKTFFQRLFSR